MSYRHQKSLFRLIRQKCRMALLLFIVFSTIAYGKTEPVMRFEHVTIDPNFMTPKLYSMIQDRYGFIWLGTGYGLYRYDGYEFKRFHHLENDTTSLPSNLVISLAEDESGDIWVGTNNYYLCKFERNREKFILFKIPAINFKDQSKHSIVNFITKDYHNNLWMICSDQVFKFDKTTNTFKKYSIIFPFNKYKVTNEKTRLVKFGITGLFCDSQHQLWVLTSHGIYKYREDTDRFTIVDEKPLNLFIGKNVCSMFEDREHYYWFGLQGSEKFYKYDPSHRSIQTFYNPFIPFSPKTTSSAMNRIQAFQEDLNGNLWLRNSFNGLGILERKSGRIVNSVDGSNPFPGINSPYISCVLIDRSGTVWAGNVKNGLLRGCTTNKFKTIQKEKNSINTLNDNRITALFQDRSGIIWIGTRFSGLNRYDPKKNTFRQYRYNKQDFFSLNNDHVKSIAQDHLGKFWIGTTKGLNLFDPVTEHFKQYTFKFNTPRKTDNPKNQFISCIYEDSEHTLWLGSASGGLIEFHPDSKKYQVYATTPNNNTSVNAIQSFCEDDDGNIWISAFGYGLRIFNKKQKEFIKEYRYDPNDPGSIPNERINCIFKDKSNNIWIGTIFGGLSKYNRQTESFINFTEKDGLMSNDVFDIAEDDYSYIWVVTRKGISKFDPANLSFINYGERDSLSIFNFIPDEKLFVSQMSIGTITKLSDGDFLVGSSNGMVRFNPREIAHPVNTSPLYLTHFKVFNKDMEIDNPIWLAKELHLTYKDYIFSFEFSHLDFKNPAENQYAYYLEGFEKDWNPPSTKRIVQYMNVSPGHYTFRVKAANSDGVWSERQLSVRVIIKPPYWKTWWFKITSTLLLGMIVFGIFWMRLLAIKQQKIELENTVTERTLELNEKKEALQVARDELEQRVIERTSELAKTNEDLLNEITERKRTEYALQNSERTSRALLNAPPDSAMLLSPDGRILAINAPFLNMIGKPDQRTEDFIGLSIFGFNPPARLSQRKENFQKCIQSRKPVQFEDISNNRILAHSIYPITDSEGGINAIAIYSRDVTDQKEAEKILKQSKEDLEILVGERTTELNKTNQQLVKEIKVRKLTEENLRVSEEQFRDLFENANDAIWTSDVKGNFTSVNIFLESLIGYTKDELLKMNPTEIIAPEHRFRLMHNFMKVAHGQSAGIEIEVLPKDGVRKILWLRFRPIWNHSDVVGIHGIGRDITNLRRAEENLKRAENQKRESLKEVTLKIAHEIKNPLASIKSSAQLVLSSPDYGEIPNIKRHMEIINRNTDVCNRVIRELYNFTTQLEFKVTQISADEFIDKLIAYATQKAGADRQIQIVVNKDPKFVSFEGDEFRLIQVFNNIINNAVEAIRSDGEINIDICLKNAEKMISFAIKDTGEGISESNLKNIFKPFFTSKPAGFGLGLTYAREIIKFHDGDIEVTSEVGKGTTFQIMIPVKQEKKI